MISSKKTMLSAYFSGTCFVSIEFLSQGQKYNSQFFIETILPSLVPSLSLRDPKLKVTTAHLHRDNTKPQNSRLSIRETEEYGFIRMPQPPDSAACHFFLFGYLKSQLEGKTLFDENDVKKELEELGRHFELRSVKDLKRRVRQISRLRSNGFFHLQLRLWESRRC
jgi:hypothetical protein